MLRAKKYYGRDRYVMDVLTYAIFSEVTGETRKSLRAAKNVKRNEEGIIYRQFLSFRRNVSVNDTRYMCTEHRIIKLR